MGGVIFVLVLEDVDPTLGKGFYFYKQVCYKIEDSPVPPKPFPMVEETGLQTMHHFLQNLITDFVMSSKSVTRWVRLLDWSRVLERPLYYALMGQGGGISMNTDTNDFFPDMEWHESVYCGVGYIDVAGVNLQDLSYKEEQLKNDLLRADPYESFDLLAWVEYGDDIWRLMNRRSEIYYEELSKMLAHENGWQLGVRCAVHWIGLACWMHSSEWVSMSTSNWHRRGWNGHHHGLGASFVPETRVAVSWILCPRDPAPVSVRSLVHKDLIDIDIDEPLKKNLSNFSQRD
ncbi:hypothetical protein SELMODRAFT_427839 [Selaginella moellendorffii]|uniref:Uncharacterized protein n=1 Tax=Selaginella moellendorffii TaxID=88036 RepID=D8T0V6_SELML|nr:hypothetical protein SELMODRAFT_427839 [Selaginella moellendorffii]